MRILYLNPDGELGGGERSLLDLMASLASRPGAAELRVICATDGPFVQRARSLGAAVTILEMPPELAGLGDSSLVRGAGGLFSLATGALRGAASLRPYLGKLRREILRAEPDIVHTNGNKCHLLAALAGTGGVPLIWHVRDFLGARRVLPRLLRSLRSKVRLAVAISRAVGDDVERVLPGVPVRVIYNAVDTDYFSPGEADPAWLDRAAALPLAPGGTVRAGLVATYGLWKGHEVFLEAARRVASGRSGQEIRFYIIGGPIYRTAGSQISEGFLRERITALGLEGRVGLLGFQEDTLEVYRALDIAVHASTQPEPFGRTIAEAMACGRAVVVSRAGGAAELFTPGEDALGAVPRDAESLARAVEKLAADAKLRERLGVRARRTAVERFSRVRLGREMAALYGEIERTEAR